MKNFILIAILLKQSCQTGHLRVKAVDELIRLVILVGYIWVVCELLSVNKSIVLSKYHLSYAEYAFANHQLLGVCQGIVHEIDIGFLRNYSTRPPTFGQHMPGVDALSALPVARDSSRICARSRSLPKVLPRYDRMLPNAPGI